MEQNTCNKCGRPIQYATESKCNYCDACMSEYCGCRLGRIKEMEPTCDSTAVIPSITVESVEGITNLANCFVHVNDINTTFYIDDKHRPMITWAGPVDIPGYDMENNPNGYRDQIVTDIERGIAVIYDKHGNGYTFGIYDSLDADGAVTQAINDKLDEMAADGTLTDIISQYIGEPIFGFDTVEDMKASTTLKAGDRAKTLGFHTVNDGGGATYRISDTGTANEMDVIAVNDLRAHLVHSETLMAEQIGAYGDDIHDDTNTLNYLVNNYKKAILSKTYKISSSLFLKTGNVVDGQNTGQINCDANENGERYIFVLENVENVVIQNIKLNSTISFPTAPRPDHPNWNGSQSSNVTAFHITNGSKQIRISNIRTHYMYSDLTTLSDATYGKNKDIFIEDYHSEQGTASTLYLGWCENVKIKNFVRTVHPLPLPGTHFVYLGLNGGKNIELEDCSYVGNSYNDAALCFAYAGFNLGDTTEEYIIVCRNCNITGPSPVYFKNDKISCTCNNCIFTNIPEYFSDDYPTLHWRGTIRSDKVNSAHYIFNSCSFTTNAEDASITEALITGDTDGATSASFNSAFDFDSCIIDNIKNITSYNAVDSAVNIKNSVINATNRIFQKLKFNGTYMLDNCIVNLATDFIAANTGSNGYTFIIKDCYINRAGTGQIFYSNDANAFIELYNNVINTGQQAGFISGSYPENVTKHNTLVNKNLLT